MNEKAGLVICLQKIEKKVDWKPSEDWTDYDFKLLKKEIHSCSGISISTHTLKRLFGKIKYKSDYSPQHATKDALAQFIGFDSWEDFLRSSEDEIGRISKSEPVAEEKQEKGRPGNGNKVRMFAFTAGAISVAAIVFFASRSRIPEASFAVENPVGTVPHTVSFVYDISKVRSNQIFIDFNFVHPELGGDFILMDRQRNLLNHTYQVPGVFHPRLVINNQPIDSGLVVARSNGWIAFFHRMGETNRFWMDNMVETPSYKEFMFLSRKDLLRYGFDTTGIYYTTHRNIRDFGLSADDFKLEVKFRNGPGTGGISCYDSRFTVMGEHSNSLVWMMEENCHQFCELKFGENHYVGETSDLSYLARDLSSWIILLMEVKDKNAMVFFNDEKIYEGRYTSSSGEIKGLEARFKGSGMVDYMLLTTPENDTVFYDGFGE